jgi:hypothetical protein
MGITMTVRSISLRSRDGVLAAALAATFFVAAPVGVAFAGDHGVGRVEVADGSGSGREPTDRGCTAPDSTPDLYRGNGSALCGVNARQG